MKEILIESIPFIAMVLIGVIILKIMWNRAKSPKTKKKRGGCESNC